MFPNNPEFLLIARELSAQNEEATRKGPLYAKDLQAGMRINGRAVERVFILGDNVEVTWHGWVITHHNSFEEF